MFKRILVLFASLFFTIYSSAETPMKDIQVIVPYNGASGVAQVFRVLQKYGASRGVNLVPVFKPGAESMIALNDAANGTHNPDNTAVFTVVSDTIIDYPFKKFDKSHFIPVSALVETKVYIVASNNAPVNNLTELLNSIKNEPSKLNWAIANAQFYEDLKSMSKQLGVSIDQLVVTKFNGPPSIQNVIGGFYDVSIYPAGIISPHIEAKRLKLIGVYRNNDKPDSTVDSVENHMNILKRQGYGLFLLKGASSSTSKFWSKFCQEFLEDQESQKLLVERHFLPAKNGDQLIRQLMNEFKSDISLTSREEEIAGLIRIRGLSNKQISTHLGIGESAVKVHVTNILKKYHIHSRTQLAAFG